MRKLSYLLIVILLSSFIHLIPSLSLAQPNNCININGIKTQELQAQFNIWLNEPDGLNDRFIDETETSQERGERLFYDLVLNNNQICLSDLTQEMINSITLVINSYDNAIDHSYLVNEFQVSRSEINLGFKAIRDPIILGNPSIFPSIFAEAIQFTRPDSDNIDSILWTSQSSGFDVCTNVECYIDIDEITRNDTDYIIGAAALTIQGFTLSDAVNPLTNENHFINYTAGKNSAGGKQVDWNQTLTQGASTIIRTDIHVDVLDGFPQWNITLTTGQAGSITDYTDLRTEVQFEEIGGGAGRNGQQSWYQLVIPSPIGLFDIQTALPIETISQMLFQVHGGTSGGLHHFALQEEFQEHNNFSNWVEGFRDTDIIRLRLCALPTPVSRNATNHILRFTALSRGTGVVERLSIHLLNSTQDIIQEFPETDISRTSFITHNFTLTQANADAIDDYSLIFIELHVTNLSVNDDESIFVTQAQLDIPETDLTVICIPEEEVLGTSELFPLAPLMNLFFIIGGFLLVFNAKGRLEFQASGMFFFLASLLFIISPIYAILDSNNVLSYQILNYPDSIRNNFVLINFVFIGLGLTSVIINNRGRIGL